MGRGGGTHDFRPQALAPMRSAPCRHRVVPEQQDTARMPHVDACNRWPECAPWTEMGVVVTYVALWLAIGGPGTAAYVGPEILDSHTHSVVHVLVIKGGERQ
ncbi:hypothetical protein DENSPDRAFT_678405 [Dentipellis sp. KUC8613]|nr:hypothetical protein DENSPDRAFT_678405 [Dentipellis sp. KUC8613]